MLTAVHTTLNKSVKDLYSAKILKESGRFGGPVARG